MNNKNVVENKIKLDDYILLLNLSYHEAVQKLLLKYGTATSNYYQERSYNRFLNKEIKSITKGKYQRTKEGLYCHHIDEYEFENVSNKEYIRKYRYPYYYQKKERLVYCDLIEHLILHTLITKETDGERGYNGYIIFIRPMVNEWYLDEIDPKPEWMKICKNKSYLNPNHINILLEKIDIIINKAIKRQYMKRTIHKNLKKRLNLNMTIQEYREYQEDMKRKEEMKKELQYRIMELRGYNSIIQTKKEAIDLENQFYLNFPSFKKYNISPSQSRKKILDALFEYKYKNIFSNKKELNSFKINHKRDELLKELHSILEDKI